jgi:NAD(P)-dependent dehydrogenase (short-subunit alcohol dehydrogenase family)
LGLGIAKSLARAGARLALVDCNPTVVDHIAGPIFADSAIALVKDLAAPHAAEELMHSALDKLGHLDECLRKGRMRWTPFPCASTLNP